MDVSLFTFILIIYDYNVRSLFPLNSQYKSTQLMARIDGKTREETEIREK